LGETTVSKDDDRRSGKDRRGEDQRKSTKDRRVGADRRLEARIRKRLPCEFVDGDTRLRGFVLDVSPKGMFVQTLKPINPGGEIGVIFTPPELGQTIEVRACVVRSLRVPRHLATVATAGVGLRINMAPPEYYDFVASLSNRDEKAATAGDVTAGSERPEKPKHKLPPRMPKPKTQIRYRVQTKQTGGLRSRLLIFRATSREHAERQAREQISSDWEIVKVERA
jgi:hypothetical protein